MDIMDDDAEAAREVSRQRVREMFGMAPDPVSPHPQSVSTFADLERMRRPAAFYGHNWAQALDAFRPGLFDVDPAMLMLGGPNEKMFAEVHLGVNEGGTMAETEFRERMRLLAAKVREQNPGAAVGYALFDADGNELPG